MDKKHYRSIFISDVHLGSRGAQAEALDDFLKNNTCDNLYLVGDIIDFWALRRKIYFPESHVRVIRRLLKRQEQGVKVTYIVGNHDEVLRDFIPLTFGEMKVLDDTIHTAADGKRYLVIHGDQFDQVMRYAKWLAWLGDIGYALLLRSNTVVNWFRRRFGLGHWSLSAYVKYKVKMAVNFIGEFEQTVAKAAKDHNVDGVICGHIHHAEDRQIDGIAYLNDGDWVESCTALVENEHGRMSVITWNYVPSAVPEPVEEKIAA